MFWSRIAKIAKAPPRSYHSACKTCSQAYKTHNRATFTFSTINDANRIIASRKNKDLHFVSEVLKDNT